MVAVGWLWLLLCMVTGLAKFKVEFPVWWLPVGTWRGWWARIWRFSTTIGFAVVLHPNHGARVRRHEFVHVRQFRDQALLGLMLGGAAFWWGDPCLALALWIGSPLFMVPNFFGAVIGGGDIYRDAEHERSAYGQTDELDGPGSSWLERKEKDVL
jgi:hypothetical protein